MATPTNSTSENSSLEASFSHPANSGFGKADQADHAYGDSYYRTLANDPAAGTSHFTEETLREYIQETLNRHHDIEASGIHVELKHGEVFLTGTVPSPEMIPLSENVVSRIQGVAGVTNRLTVL